MQYVKFPPYVKALLLSLLVIVIVFVMIVGKPILVPLLVSAFMAMLLVPFCDRLERFKLPRSISAFIAVLVMLVGIAALVYFAVVQLQRFAEDLEENFIQNVDKFALKVDAFSQQYLGKDLHFDDGVQFSQVLDLLSTEQKPLSEVALETLGTIGDVLLLPVFVFFLLIYRDHFCVFIMKVFKRERNSVLMGHVRGIRHIVHAYISGAGKVMLILAIVNTAILMLLGVKHAIFFGVLSGLLNIIPYLGPMLGAILPFLYALLTKDSLFYPFAVVISFTLVQFLEGTFLTPKITGANVNLNAFVTFLGLLIGGAIWGIEGMILIIPSIAILKRLFELSPDTEPYAYLFGAEDSRWFKKHRVKQQVEEES